MGRPRRPQVPRRTKRFHHPIVGDLEFIGESLDVSNAPGLIVLAFTVEPGSTTEQAMAWLGSWNAAPPHRPGLDHHDSPAAGEAPDLSSS